MKDNTDYVMTDIPPEPMLVALDEKGTTLELKSEPEQPTQKEIKLTQNKFMEVLRKMLGTEQITQQQMLEMRRRFGISNASFHKKKADPAKKKRARKLARAKRRVNRHNGSLKGQTRNHGHHS